MKKSSYSAFKNSIIKGFARAIDIIGSVDRKAVISKFNSNSVDTEALKSDWENVGNDIKFALNKYHSEAQFGK